MYRLGDAVVVRIDGRMSVGEIVSVRAFASQVAYDVSCESTTLKALFEDEVAPASIKELETELNGMVNVRMVDVLGLTDAREDMRRALLRGEHAHFLRSALSRMQLSNCDDLDDSEASVAIGERVALRSGDSFDLGVVSGLTRRGDEVHVRVDVMDEVRTVSPDDLCSLSDVPVARGGFALGERARFVVSGKEQDDSYVGTVCRVSCENDLWEYALAFDDGDVFEELGPEDLVAV